MLLIANHDTAHLHNNSRTDQLARNFYRLDRSVWNARQQAPRWLDQVVSDHDGRDERDRLFLSVPWFHPSDCTGNHVAVGARGCDLRALSAAARRPLALDLRSLRCDCAIFQRLRGRRAGVRKSAGLESARSDADGTTI